MRFRIGVIEGFYGRQYTWEQREKLVELMGQWGFHSYVYAPKGDASLRSAWHQPFSRVHHYRLRSLGEASREAGLAWGVGFSPAGLQARFNTADRRRLSEKIHQIKSLQLDELWLLFDDLPAGNPDLAQRQLEVIAVVRDDLPGVKLAVCPSYYSEDPILEALFGACPADYFDSLAAGVDKSVDVLWTGPQVISEAYTQQDMERARLLLGRKPLLWDNYPVNDGRKSSRFVNLYPFRGRPSMLSEWTAGHFVNPMNQFELSCLVLPALPMLYREAASYEPERVFEQLLTKLPVELADSLHRDWQLFQERGLDELTENNKAELITLYGQCEHPVALEIVAWLKEQYRFDPNCLTE